MKNTWKLWGVLGTAAVCGAFGCSSSSNGNSGGGGGGSATGGAAGAGTGGVSSGTGGDDNQGTGGTNDEVVRGPHAELFDCSAPEGTVPELALEPFLTDLDVPTFIKPVPGTTNRFVVGHLFGRIALVEDGVIQGDDFLDLTSRIERGEFTALGGDERGLFDLAFHPDFENNGLFYVHHSAASGLGPDIAASDTVLAEYRMRTDGSGQADPNSMRIVFTAEQPTYVDGSGEEKKSLNHNGGGLAFGADGYLYLALGDGGGSNDEYMNGQNVTTPLAAIVRLDVDGRDAGEYSIPEGNLADVVSDAHAAIWSYGLRNPYRISFDGCTGDLYIADVGQSAWEEVNVAPPGEGQKNYGWPIMEGDRCRGDGGDPVTPEQCLGASGAAVPLSLPAVSFQHGGFSSITGGYVYRGSAIPALRGAYFYADLGTGRLWTFRWNGTAATEVTERTDDLWPMGDAPPDIISFGQDAHGELFIVRSGNPLENGPTGAILRLVAP